MSVGEGRISKAQAVGRLGFQRGGLTYHFIKRGDRSANNVAGRDFSCLLVGIGMNSRLDRIKDQGGVLNRSL